MVSLITFREGVLNTTDVVLNVKCELRNALRKARPHSGWLTTPGKSWSAGFTLTLNVVARADLGAEAGFTFPLTPGVFTVAFGTGGYTQATRTETFDFTENLGELLAFDRCPGDIVNDHYILFEGRLGFEDILARVLASRDIAKVKLTSLAYNLDFDIEKGGSASPSFSLIPIGASNTFGGGITLAAKRTDSNTLRVVFSPPVLSFASRKCSKSTRCARSWSWWSILARRACTASSPTGMPVALSEWSIPAPPSSV